MYSVRKFRQYKLDGHGCALKQALTVQQVAELLQVNDRTIYRMVSKGEIPGFRVAGSWRFLPEDVEAWIDQQKVAVKSGRNPDLKDLS